MAQRMYPRVKVRDSEQEDIACPEYDSGTRVFLKLIESLYLEEEEKHKSKCPESASKITKACPQHITMRSTPSTKGKLKGREQVGASQKPNAKASSVLRPRAVLSSPENDGLIGSINDLINNVAATHGQKDAGGKVGDQANVLSNQVKVGKSLNKEGSEALKGKTPLKVKCTLTTFDL